MGRGLRCSKEELVVEIDAGVTTEKAEPRLLRDNGTSNSGHSVESRFSRAVVFISGHPIRPNTYCKAPTATRADNFFRV